MTEKRVTQWEANTTYGGYTVNNIFSPATGVLIATVNNPENTEFLTTAANACKAVNPDHPEAVADKIVAVFDALKEARITLNVLQPNGSAVLREIDAVLDAVEKR